MKHIPITLIYLRLLIGFTLFGLSFIHFQNFAALAIVLFSIGLLSDVFDGIIARRLQISTEKLCRLDSGVDQVFWCLVAVSAYNTCPAFFRQHLVELLILIGFEAAIYLVSFLRFKKEVATHTISSKIWTLLLFATLVQIFAACNSSILFQLFLWAGIITRIEIIAILFLLKKWTNDVPSIYHAIQLRKGNIIKRNKLFNG